MILRLKTKTDIEDTRLILKTQDKYKTDIEDIQLVLKT